MSRRGSVAKRIVLPDPVYGNIMISKLVHAIMMQGKKSVAERIVYNALEVLAKKTKMDDSETFHLFSFESDQKLKNSGERKRITFECKELNNNFLT